MLKFFMALVGVVLLIAIGPYIHRAGDEISRKDKERVEAMRRRSADNGKYSYFD